MPDSGFWLSRGEKLYLAERRLGLLWLVLALCHIYRFAYGDDWGVHAGQGRWGITASFLPYVCAYGALVIATHWRKTYLRFRIPIVVVVRVVTAWSWVWATEHLMDGLCYTGRHFTFAVSMITRTLFSIQTHVNTVEVFCHQLPFSLQVLVVGAKAVFHLRSPFTLLVIQIHSVWSYWEAGQRLHNWLHTVLVVVPSQALVSPWDATSDSLQQCTACVPLILLLFAHLSAHGLLLYCYYFTERRHWEQFLAENSPAEAVTGVTTAVTPGVTRVTPPTDLAAGASTSAGSSARAASGRQQAGQGAAQDLRLNSLVSGDECAVGAQP